KLEAYVYTNGSAVTSADAELYSSAGSLSTTYTPANTPGWYRLSAIVQGSLPSSKYGLNVKINKTVYVDDMSLRTYTSGNLTSNIFDTSMGSNWDSLSHVGNGVGQYAIKVRSSNNSNMAGAADFAGCPALESDEPLDSNPCTTDSHRYVQYQVSLTG